MTRLISGTAILFVVLAACSSGPPPVPDGYQRLQHPLGSIAVPEDWELREAPERIEELDSEVRLAALPDASLERPRGGYLYETISENAPFRAADEAIVLEVAEIETFMSVDQVRRELIEVPGSEDAVLLQYTGPQPEEGEPVRLTYLGALTDRGSVLVANFIGTAEQIPDEVIEAARETFHVDGGA